MQRKRQTAITDFCTSVCLKSRGWGPCPAQIMRHTIVQAPCFSTEFCLNVPDIVKNTKNPVHTPYLLIKKRRRTGKTGRKEQLRGGKPGEDSAGSQERKMHQEGRNGQQGQTSLNTD